MLQDLQKKIDSFPENLHVADAQNVWKEVFVPQLDQLNIKKVQDDYDTRGKALLDQIYAPLGHGDTKPRWDQIPKDERIAAAAYAAVSALTGHGARGLQALARPLTIQEQENVKKEQEAQQNEEMRRQGLVEQFKVLMGDKTAAIAELNLSQREKAARDAAEKKMTFEEKKQTDLNVNRAEQRMEQYRKGDLDQADRPGALAQYTAEMQQATGNAQWKPTAQDEAWAKNKSSKEQARDALTTQRKKNEERKEALAKPTLDWATARAAKMGVDKDISDYRLKNILPHMDQNLQEHYAKQVLDVAKLNDAEIHGWVKNSAGGTLLKDAHGNLILDSGGRPIKTVAEARAKVADIDSLLRQQSQELAQDMLRDGFDQQTAAEVQGQIRDGIRQGKSAKEIEGSIHLGLEHGLFFPLAQRAIAIEKMRFDNQALRAKLGEAQAEPAGGGPIQHPASETPPAGAQHGATWTRASDNSNWVFTQGAKGLGWYRMK